MNHLLSVPLRNGLLLVACWLCVQTSAFPDEIRLVRPPYLQNVTEHSLVLRWRTHAPAATRVNYGTAPGQWTTTLETPEPVTEHRVRITGLRPATRYYYAVGTGKTTLAGGEESHYFTTAPSAGTARPVRFWVVGDSGQCGQETRGCTQAAAVRDAYRKVAGGRLADLWLMLGDNAYYAGSDRQFTKGLFEIYRPILRNTPLWTALGNHDLQRADARRQQGPYFEAFSPPLQGEAGGVPSGTAAYYAFNWGNLHFISLDSATGQANLTREGAMYQWLERDLRHNRADWTIVFWHHPPYTKGSHDSDDPGEASLLEMRERFVPLLESRGLDLHLSGHSHGYERSRLIDGHYGTSEGCGAGECFVDGGDGHPAGDGAYRKAGPGPVPHAGTVYAVVGSSSKLGRFHGRHPVMAHTLATLGSLLVDIAGNRLDARFIDHTGEVRDHFQILKGD